MRLRLVYTLSLLLVSAVLIAVLAMGAVMAWSLNSGFATYLHARDVERLEKFATIVAEAASQAGGMDALRARGPGLRELLDAYAEAQGLPLRRAPRLRDGPPGPQRGEPPGPPLDALAGPLRDAPTGPPPDGAPKRLPPGGGDEFDARITVVSTDGKPLFGRSPPMRVGDYIERPVRLRSEVVALVRLRESGRVPDAVETSFLRNQYLAIAWVSVFFVVLALACAWWVARRWVRPLQAAQDATARISRGELDVRVQGGHIGIDRTDEIGDLLRNINQMTEGLQRLESSRRRWLADISHELRTPLAGLRGDIEALVDGVRPLRLEAIESLRDKALQLGALVDDLHLLAMSDLQALPCEFVDVDAVVLAQQAVSRFATRAATEGFSLEFQPVDLHTPLALWDKQRIAQLLDNLMENSFRYTDAPGHIVLTLRKEENNAVMIIEDSAPGVLDADLPRLFEPLYRADAARSRQRGGSGLGLAISEAIVCSHGGRIQASLSTLGGLCIRVELPLSEGLPS